jgi:hypothetical protein
LVRVRILVDSSKDGFTLSISSVNILASPPNMATTTEKDFSPIGVGVRMRVRVRIRVRVRFRVRFRVRVRVSVRVSVRVRFRVRVEFFTCPYSDTIDIHGIV